MKFPFLKKRQRARQSAMTEAERKINEQIAQKRRREAEDKYRAQLNATSEEEAEAATKLLDDPRIKAAGFAIENLVVSADVYPHQVLRLFNLRKSMPAYDVVTPTERATYAFVAEVMRRVERREVTDLLMAELPRAAKVGWQIYNAGDENATGIGVTVNCADSRCWDRTYVGLQTFLFDLNAEEIFQQFSRRFSADLERLHWQALKDPRNIKIFAGTETYEFAYSEAAFDQITSLINTPPQASS